MPLITKFSKLAIAAMRKLRVLKMYECSFVAYDDKMHRLLKTAEPYITWGPPDVRTIRELLTKRGFAQIDVSCCVIYLVTFEFDFWLNVNIYFI